MMTKLFEKLRVKLPEKARAAYDFALPYMLLLIAVFAALATMDGETKYEHPQAALVGYAIVVYLVITAIELATTRGRNRGIAETDAKWRSTFFATFMRGDSTEVVITHRTDATIPYEAKAVWSTKPDPKE